MKKALLTLICLTAIMAAGTSLKAQEVTIVLNPGWTWISNPSTDTLDFTTVLGSFTPAVGDIIRSQWGSATYMGGQWRGTISQFYPGYGYKYKSTRTMPIMLTFNAQQPAPQVIVTTSEPTDITANSATCGGNVASSDGNYVFVILRGICWSTNPNPTFNDNYVEVGNGIGSFTASMTDLTPNTTYYVRAFAVTATGSFYGDQQSFTTPSYIVNVLSNPTDGGMVTGEGSYEQGQSCTVTATANLGYTFTNWTENGSVVSTDDTYTFTVSANRTMVANFTPTGAINGLFSVSDSTQVYFSQGNLQYQASTNTWRFAENQFDFVGNGNSNISPTYNGWIDLFGWGTSGYHDANDPYNVNYQPWSTSMSQVNSSYNYYGYGPSTNMSDPNLTGTSANYDWGVYNPISNGGNTANQWRTLTQPEWNYVFNTRTTTSGIRYAKANVNNVNGVILLPDDWSSSTYSLSNTNSSGVSFGSNTMTASQWSTLEQAGAVFLPAAGSRLGTSVLNVGFCGDYCSASYDGSGGRYCVCFYDSSLNAGDFGGRYGGQSVRLVRVAE